MRISTKARYGLRAIIDLTVNSYNEHIPLKAIAERQNVSANYLESIFSTLRKSGLIKSVKGMQGGYVLGDTPANITLGMILRTLEGDLSIVDEEQGGEDEIENFITQTIWDKINDRISAVIDSYTLEDLVNEYKRLNNESTNMYYI